MRTNLVKLNKKRKKIKWKKWVWSRILDIYEEEMKRGKTHEYTAVNFTYNDQKLTLIDTPGHGTYVREMIYGISQGVNIAVLLVSMANNEFESSFERGMTKEHLILARALNIKHLIILANKMDLIDWDRKIYNERMEKVYKFLKQIRWNNDYIQIIPISAYQGINLTDTIGTPEWYTGKSFLETVSDIETPSITEESSILSESNRLIVEMLVLELKAGVIGPGFKCVCHMDDFEFEVELVGIRNKKYIKQGESGIVILQLSNTISCTVGKRIIFRTNNYTLGFGKIIKLK